MSTNSKTKLVLLGTGTPNAEPERSGPSLAIVVNESSYIVDFGAGVVRQASKAFKNGISSLKPKNLKTAFLTHLHSDHTTGYADLIFTPWVLGRKEPLKVFGPVGLKNMTNHILSAYERDLKERLEGLEPANNSGHNVDVTEIKEGIVYSDENVKVEAFKVKHGSFEAFGYKFYTEDKTIVISGDTAPIPTLIEHYKDCDILVHEVYSTEGLTKRPEEWRKYHSSVHTSSVELGEIAEKSNPKQLVLYHQLYFVNLQGDTDIEIKVKERDEKIIEDIKKAYNGAVFSGKDLEVF